MQIENSKKLFQVYWEMKIGGYVQYKLLGTTQTLTLAFMLTDYNFYKLTSKDFVITQNWLITGKWINLNNTQNTTIKK